MNISVYVLVCRYFKLGDMVEVAKEVGTEMAAKFASKAKTGLVKTYEQSKERIVAYVTEEKKRIEEELKEEDVEKEKKKPAKKSFFSRALKWTKEFAKDIAEEYQKEAIAPATAPATAPIKVEKTGKEEEEEEEGIMDKQSTETTSTSTSDRIDIHQQESIGMPSEQSTVNPVMKEEGVETVKEKEERKEQVVEVKEEKEEEEVKLVSLKSLETDDMVKLRSLMANPAVHVYPLNEVQTSSGIIGEVGN